MDERVFMQDRVGEMKWELLFGSLLHARIDDVTFTANTYR